MSVEIPYVPESRSRRLPVAALTEALAAAGVPCRIEPESERMSWLALRSSQSTILVSVDDGGVALATLHLSGDDPTSVPEAVDRVMRSLGLLVPDEGVEWDE